MKRTIRIAGQGRKAGPSTEIYTGQQISEWNRADAFKNGERNRLASRLKKRTATSRPAS